MNFVGIEIGFLTITLRKLYNIKVCFRLLQLIHSRKWMQREWQKMFASLKVEYFWEFESTVFVGDVS